MAKYFKKSLELLDKYDSYMVTGKPDSKGDTPAAGLEVTVRRERNYPNFDFSGHANPSHELDIVSRNTGLSTPYLTDQILNDMDGAGNGYGAHVSNAVESHYAHESYGNPNERKSGIDYAKSISKVKKNVQPTELFTTEPRSATITAAVFDPSLKHTMPTVGAMVHQEHGIPITADESLSRASSKLAKNAQQKGLPVMGHQGNPTFEQNNTVPMTAHYFSNDYEKNEALEGFTEIHPDKVREAKNHLRGLLGREPKDTRNHLSPQFSQTQLPGMENF